MSNKTKTPRLNDESVFWGIVFGTIIGVVLGLLNLPSQWVQKRQDLLQDAKQVRQRVELETPIADSMANGKVLAANRLRDERETLG